MRPIRMRRRTAVPALLLALLAMAGCGQQSSHDSLATGPATVPPASASPTGPELGRAAAVARAWSGSAQQKTWRTGYYPLRGEQEWIPSGAFHSGADKAAYLAGQLDLRTALPSAPASGEVRWADGSGLSLPLLSAEQVFRRLTTGKSCPTSQCALRLAVTAIAPGTRTLATSRGQATVPVWEFTLAGYPGTFDYPAIEQPAPTLAAPVAPLPSNGTLVPVGHLSAASADGLTLTGLVGYSSCSSTLAPGQVYETDDAVVLIGEVHDHSRPANTICAATASAGPAQFHLSRPVGTRTVLDAASGRPLALTPPPGS